MKGIVDLAMKFLDEFITVTIECIGLAIVFAIVGGIIATLGRLVWLVWR